MQIISIKKTIIFFSFLTFGMFAMYAQSWETDFETAKKLALENDRKIVLVFQGSDWCAPCIKLDKEIWSTKEFKEYAKNHFIMLQADFPRKKKNALSKEQQNKNNALAEMYNGNGYFPFVVILDKTGKKLKETGYKKTTPSEYIKYLTTL